MQTLSSKIIYSLAQCKAFLLKYKIGLGIGLGLFICFLCLDWAMPLPYKVPYSQIVLAKDSTILHAYLSSDQKWRIKTELHEISPMLRKVLIYKEDKYFYYHFGFNPFALLRASLANVWHWRKTSGASTITMQVVRMLEPKQRTYKAKIWELFRTLQLEWHCSKEEILQLYLNLVPYSGNIEGVKSAGLLFFSKKPNELSLAEVLTLAIIPNRPSSLVLGKNNTEIIKQRNKWLKIFQKRRVFEETKLKNALSEPLHAVRKGVPNSAPQFCRRVRQLYPQQTNIYTTLNPEKQEKISLITLDYAKKLKQYNISNASVLVINNQTHEVESYVASVDFEDKFNNGEVDGICGVRSPGSTLKPFLYAMAIDAGIISPKTILADVPSSFSGFEPENFYKQFAGNITAEKALIQSLNIPAVYLLEKIGASSFIGKLKQAGFLQIAKDDKKLGLSMILGGCGATLEELTSLFSIFANEGKYSPAKLVRGEKASSTPLISPEASYLLGEILSQTIRPDLPNKSENALRLQKIAWKTGTSHGRHDAWSIGYNAQYTVGIWIGNFSGEAVNQLVGAEKATPLLFQIFNAINYEGDNTWFAAPQNLKARYVCQETGLPPAPYCQKQILDYYIPLISPKNTCQHLSEVWVSEDEKQSYCLSCLPPRYYKQKMYANISPEIQAFYEARELNFHKIPAHNPQCTRLATTGAPTIISPVEAREYLIDRNNPPELLLACKVQHDVRKVYWYLNGQFYKAVAPSERVFFVAEIGNLKISCTDDKGRNSEIQVRILYE